MNEGSAPHAVRELSPSEADQLREFLRVYETRPLRELREYCAAMPAPLHELLSAIWEPLREQLRANREEYERWLHSGTFESDVMLLLVADTDGVPPEERWEAALRIAATVSSWFCDPQARREIRRIMDSEGTPAARRRLQSKILPAAVMMVFDKLHARRYLRLGPKWANARRIPMLPEDAFTESEFRTWVLQEIRNAAEAILLDRPYPPALSRGEDAGTTESVEHDDGAAASAAPLIAAAAQLSPRQRELVRHLQSGVRRSDLHLLMGIARPTVRAMLHQLRQRLRA